MLSVIETINTTVNNFIWGVPAMICIIGVGLYLRISSDQEIPLRYENNRWPHAPKT